MSKPMANSTPASGYYGGGSYGSGMNQCQQQVVIPCVDFTVGSHFISE